MSSISARSDAQPALKRELGLWDLVFFNIASVASVRWVAAAAHAGPGSISLWVLAIVTFFIPSALVIAALSERFPEEGGLYIWTKRAFGDWHGFLCAWLYFVSNLLYVPGLALAGVAISSFIWNADANRAAESRMYTIPVTMALVWAAYLSHLFGLRIGKWVANIGGGSTYAAAALLAIAALVLAYHGSSATHFELVPVASWDNLNIWSQIAFALVGLELGPILGGEIFDPRRTVPRAAGISAIGCAVFYIAGTATVLFFLQAARISQVTGLAQAGTQAALRLGVPVLASLFVVLIVAGIVGSLGSWIAGNARLPFVIGLDNYLPPVFAKLHPRWGTPYLSILFQLVISTVFLLAAQAGETLTAAYQILVDMTVITTFLPYVYIFAVGWNYGQRLASGLGLAVSLAAILLSMAPPSEVASWPVFELKVIGGCILLAYLGRVVFVRGKASQ